MHDVPKNGLYIFTAQYCSYEALVSIVVVIAILICQL